ncbi:MAG: glycosyltransferase family 4 protein [Bacteroidales bacterium]|nr:glycosyltransferase family 4 protein [Bacteroidales bacterium]
MKKVLIITYYWPPSGGAGVQRWLKFVKYLREFGWEPLLYIPENPEYPELDESLFKDVPEGITILRKPIWEPYDAYKRLIGRKKEEKINAAFLSEKKQNKFLENVSVWIRGNLFIPDARKFWINPSVGFLRSYLSENRVDAIVSTGPPHSMHLIAHRLAKQFQLPWLADFRDPWTNIDFYKDLKLTASANREHHRLERSVLEDASAVTVISNSMAEDFNRILPRKYDVITNGFDPDDTSGPTAPTLDHKFSIAHIGTLVSTRNPLPLWKALRNLLPLHPDLATDLEIKLIGKVDHTVAGSLEEYGLAPYTTRIPYLPHDQVIEAQRRSQVLLLIINNTPNAKMILTGKLFEYLAAGRPILCIGPPDGDAAVILNQTQAGVISDHDDIKTMEWNILNYYKKFKAGELRTNSKNTEAYSRKELTRHLANLLNRITSSQNPVDNS